MKRAFLLVAVVLLSLPPAWAGRHGHVRAGYHGYHHGSRVSVGFGYYGRAYYAPYSWGYAGGYYAPYAWGYAGGYYAPAPAWRVVRYRNSTGAVETDVHPKKSQVTLDGAPVGQARDFNGPWDLLVLPKGVHTVEFSAPGYMTLRVTLDVRSGGYYHFTDRLLEGDGLDPRSTEPVVLVEEEPVSSAEIVVQEEPAPRAEIVMEEEPAPRLRRGLLHVRVLPHDAAVYLDGDFLAKGDELSRLHGSIPVARGEHTLEVLRPGYKAQTITVLVEGDQPARVLVELKPND